MVWSDSVLAGESRTAHPRNMEASSTTTLGIRTGCFRMIAIALVAANKCNSHELRDSFFSADSFASTFDDETGALRSLAVFA